MEEDISVSKSSSQDTKFDEIVGHIEDIVVSDTFQSMNEDFLNKHYNQFEDTEENKLIYTPIFNEYVATVEKVIENELNERIKNFDMTAFMQELPCRKDEISEEIFEMLLSFTDFVMFKELMLDHKAFKEGKGIDLSLGITVTSLEN